jgi:hypothetical protein
VTRERGQRDQTTGQGQRDQGQRDQGQAQQPNQRRDQTTGQGQQTQPQRDQNQAQQPQQGQQKNQAQQPQQGQQNQPGQAQQRQPQQGQTQQGQIQQGQSGSVTLTSEQRTRVRQTVLTGSNVPRVSNVNFTVRVGTVIPTSVRVVPVHETLISIHPEWRGHSYFVVEDDIIIVDSGYRIVATVPVGSSSGQLEDRGGSVGAGGGGANVDVVDLSPDEIRQVQIVLNQRGFNIGDPDGVLGPRTRQALIQFQQRQGFQATGRFDSRTISALGVSVRSQGQSTTGQGQGQGGGTMQQPSTNAPAGNQPSANPPPANQQQGNQGGNQPATSGQGSAQQPGAQQPSANQPPANQRSGQGGNQPPTTGQGGAQNNPSTSGSPNMNQPNQPSQGGAGSRNTPAQDGQSR